MRWEGLDWTNPNARTPELEQFVAAERARLEPRIKDLDDKYIAWPLPERRRKVQEEVAQELVQLERDVREGRRVGSVTSSLNHWVDDYQRTETLVDEWYARHYGEQAEVAVVGPWGRVPVAIRGGVFLVTIPLVYGGDPRALERTLSQISTAPEALATIMNDVDSRGVQGALDLGGQAYLAIHDFMRHDLYANWAAPARKLWEEARADLETAILSCQAHAFTQTYFSALQTAEKSMKACLAAQGIEETELRSLSHWNGKILKRLINFYPSLTVLRPQVAQVKWRAGLRYGVEVTLQEAVGAIQAALDIMGTLAIHVVQAECPPA